MSTKIYNGYKIPGNSLDEVIGKLFENKNKLHKLIDDNIYEEILSRAINHYHNMCFSTFLETKIENEKQNPFSNVISDALEYEKNPQLKEYNMVEVSICFFPQKQELNGETYYLLMLFGGNESKVISESKVWKELKIEEFAYWDNTDPLETVTDYEWDMRGQQWSKVLDRFSPAESSLILELKKEYKFNCIYFRDKENLKEMFKDIFSKVLKSFSKKETQLLSYYEESLKEKKAYKICSPNYNLDNDSEEVNNQEKQKLYQEIRKKTRENNFTEEDLLDIAEKLVKIKKVLNTPIKIDDLFKTKLEIQKDIAPLFNIKKPKI